jgi:hypothetical protein
MLELTIGSYTKNELVVKHEDYRLRHPWGCDVCRSGRFYYRDVRIGMTWRNNSIERRIENFRKFGEH